MANDDFPRGLWPVIQPYGQVQLTPYRLTTNATVGLGIGEPVNLDANGRVALYTTGGDLAICIGPAMGFLAVGKDGLPSANTTLSSTGALAANTDAWVLVADDPGQRFLIQAGTDSTIAESNIGNTCRMTVRTVRANALTGVSNFELLSADCAGDTGGTLQLVGLSDNINSDGTENAGAANYCKAIVRIYHHALNGDTNAVPV